MRDFVCAASKPANVKLQVRYEPYERYGSGLKARTATVSGVDLLDALKKMSDNMLLYFDSDDIEDDGYTAEEVLERIEEENGDGCDFIYYIKNLTTGDTLFESDFTEDDVEDWDD